MGPMLSPMRAGVLSPHVGARNGHVDFMLFVSISFMLSGGIWAVSYAFFACVLEENARDFALWNLQSLFLSDIMMEY